MEKLFKNSAKVLILSVLASCAEPQIKNSPSETLKQSIETTNSEVSTLIAERLCPLSAKYVAANEKNVLSWERMEIPGTGEKFGEALKPHIDSLIAGFYERKAHIESLECQAVLQNQ